MHYSVHPGSTTDNCPAPPPVIGVRSRRTYRRRAGLRLLGSVDLRRYVGLHPCTLYVRGDISVGGFHS
jgi:hypothetical protein